MSNVQRLLLDKLKLRHAENKRHMDYTQEMSLYEAVKNGDFEGIKMLSMEPHAVHQGILSDDNVQNTQFHFIICAAIVARYCIEGGMNIETSYTLSDIYIEKVKQLNSVEDIIQLRYEMIHDYTARMKMILHANKYSRNVVRVKDYVDEHIMWPISIEALAEELGLNNTYMCNLFKRETGITIGKYIESKRVDLAKQYLTYTDYGFTEIADSLCYSSHSHFSNVFKKCTGMSPKEFRKKNQIGISEEMLYQS